MKDTQIILIAILVILVTLCIECQSLRCRTDDGPTEDDIKKIVRICMRKVGENETEGDYSDEYSDESDEKKHVATTQNRSNNNQQNFNGFNYQNNYQNDPYSNQMYGNNNNNWNSQNSQNSQNNFGGIQRAPSGQLPGQNGYGGYGNGYNSNSNSNGTNGQGIKGKNNNQTEQDRACLVHCFFHELKMTNNEDFPDKRKVLQTLTKDIREKEVREFYVDSIQECFHMVDNMENYNRRKNKCDVAFTIVTCLTERAKTNCEDFRDDTMIF